MNDVLIQDNEHRILLLQVGLLHDLNKMKEAFDMKYFVEPQKIFNSYFLYGASFQPKPEISIYKEKKRRAARSEERTIFLIPVSSPETKRFSLYELFQCSCQNDVTHYCLCQFQYFFFQEIFRSIGGFSDQTYGQT